MVHARRVASLRTRLARQGGDARGTDSSRAHQGLVVAAARAPRVLRAETVHVRNALMASGLALVLGCGGLATGHAGEAGDGGSADGSAPHTDATVTTDSSRTADGSAADGGLQRADAGTTCSVARTPESHRASADPCPMARGPGDTIMSDGGPTGACHRDADCTMGRNGRCLLTDFPPTTVCSYDDCYSDSDCAGNVACACRASGSSNAPNVCAVGSDCRVDSDCAGPCGYCSPSGNPFFPPALYFCHTPADTCTNDRDCPSDPGDCQQGCEYDASAGHWACAAECPP